MVGGGLSVAATIGILIIIFIIWTIIKAVNLVMEYERIVIFRLGRLIGEKGPGLRIVIPWIDRVVKIDLRTVTLDIPPQEIITRDNVTVKVNAVAYFRVINPSDAVTKVANYSYATSQISQTTLRSILGQSELDDLLAHRDKVNLELQRLIDAQTDPWGVKVSIVEVKDVELPEGMKRAMAKQAEAERERRAKIIHAEGEYQAAEKLSAAAAVMARVPTSVQLRYLQTLTEIGSEQNTTIVFPIPIDILTPFIKAKEKEEK